MNENLILTSRRIGVEKWQPRSRGAAGAEAPDEVAESAESACSCAHVALRTMNSAFIALICMLDRGAPVKAAP